MKENTARRIRFWCVFVVGAWLVIFEIPFFFTPLRFPPQEITVYRYGESAAFTRGDIEFYRIYHRLRNAGKGTIAHIVSNDLIMGSHIGNCIFSDEQETFCAAFQKK